MLKRRILVSCLLILTLVFSTIALGSCDVIKGFFGDHGTTETPDDNGGNETPDIGGEENPDDGKEENPGTGDENPDIGGDETPDVPTLSELPDAFYDAASWVYMTNNNGASLDGGDIPYAMVDGSIKFHRANQAIEVGNLTNATVSFMLKGTNDWSIWFNSSSIDNANNSSYRLNYAYGGLRIALSSAPELAAAVIDDSNYNKGEWNRFDIVFSTDDGICDIKVYINGTRAALSAGDNTTPMVSVADNTLTHTQPAMFSTGNYIVVKVWEAHNYVQLKPVAKADEEDLPIIACIGASITEGAGAGNFYTESYPAQLQNALKGQYNVVNFGNSGKTVNPNLGEESWMNQYQWTGVQAIVPDIAILNIGTNDSKTHNNPNYDDFYTNFKYLIDSLLEVNPEMRIMICTVPYAYSDIWGISNENIANIIAPVQRDVAEEYDFELIDLYEYSQNKSYLFPDGVHPNTKGYEMFVKIISKAVLEGADALTDEFIASIDAEYGPKVPDASVTVNSVVIKDMTLTITGKTNDNGLKLYVGQDPSDNSVYNTYNDLIFAENGEDFVASFDLTTMPIGGWYNVRLYFTDGFYYTVSLNELTNGEGGTYGLWSWINLENTKVQICSWDEGSIPTLSFKVEQYTKPTHTISVSGGSIVVENDKIILTVTGNTTDLGALLYVNAAEGDDPEIYGHALNIADDGSFTVSLDLGTLELGRGWYNVRLRMADGNIVPVPYDMLGVNVEDVFYCSNRKVTIKNWSAGDKLASLSIEEYDNSYTLTATEIKFENGKLVFSGATTGEVRSLTAYLYNSKEDVMEYNADAILNEDGSFTVEIDLAQLTLADGEWYYLWTSVNGGSLTKVVYENYDKSELYCSGYRAYRWEYWEGIAIAYNSFDYSITNYSISEVDGKAFLTIEGYFKDSTIAADTITLRLDKTAGTKQQLDAVNLATEAGQFKFVYDITDILDSTVTTQYKEEAYFLRLFVNGTKKADINSRWAAQDLFNKVQIGNAEYYLMRNNASNWYTLGLVKLHSHSYTSVVTAPTCTATGYTTYTCACGDSYTADEVAALGHTEVVDAAVDATCTSTGLTEGKHCSACSEVLVSQNETPKAEHSYDDQYDESCNNCDFIRDVECGHFELNTIEAVAPTCTATGLTEGKVCAKCEAVIVEQTSVPALGHTDEVIPAVDPTCQNVGYTEGVKCSVCTEVLTAPTEVAKLDNHNFVNNTCEWCGLINPTLTVTSGSIVEQDGKIILTISGNTNDKQLKLLVGPQDDLSAYGHDIAVAEDGSFTVSVELSALEAIGDWQNAKFFFYDGTSKMVTYSSVGVKENDVFYATDKKVTIKTWDGAGNLSLSVEKHDSSYTLTATEVKYENGKLVFSGVTTNVKTLTAYLYNTSEGIKDYKADAVINADGSFTVEIELSQLTMAAGNWYYLWTSVNGGDLTKVVYTSYDANEEYLYGFRTYKWAYWEGIAVNYSNTDWKNSITKAEIINVDGKPTFILEGYLNDLSIAADTITLRLDKTGGTKQQLDGVNLATEAGHFKFAYDLSDLYISEESAQYAEKAYFVRIFVNGSKHSDVNSKWAKDDLFAPVNVNGNDYYLMRNNANAYYTLGIVKLEKAAPIPVVNYTGATLENGKLVLSGTCENVTSLSVSLYDGNDTSITVDSIKGDAVINNGSFVAEVDLASVTEGRPWNWYFIMVSVNGADYANIIVSYDAAETEVVGNRTFSFIDWQGGNTAVQYIV